MMYREGQKKEFVARVYLPSLGWLVIRKEIIGKF